MTARAQTFTRIACLFLCVSLGTAGGARAQLSSELLHEWAEESEAAIEACDGHERRTRAWFRSEPNSTTRAQEAPPARAAWSACVARALASRRPPELAVAYVWVTCGSMPGCDVFAFLQGELDSSGVAWAIDEQLETNEALAACAAADAHVENLVVLLESPFDRPRARYLGDWRGPLPSERSVGECYANALAAHRFVRPAHYTREAPTLRVEFNPTAFGYHPPMVRVAQDSDRARAGAR